MRIQEEESFLRGGGGSDFAVGLQDMPVAREMPLAQPRFGAQARIHDPPSVVGFWSS